MKPKNSYDQFFKKAQAVAQSQGGVAKGNSNRASSLGAGSSAAAPSNVKHKRSSDIAIELREKMLRQKKEKSAKSSKIPWKMAGVSFLGVVLMAYAFENFDKVEKFISKIEVQMLGSAIGAEAVGKNETNKAEGAKSDSANATDEKSKAAEADKNKADDSKKKEWSQEEINHFARLNERKRELDAREAELNRIENELTAQKEELEKRMKELEKTRSNISSVLEEKVKADDQKIDTLVQMYSTMKPQQAAKVFETLDEDLSVEIISRMKKKNAAEILNLLKPEKAQMFSEKFAGYKKK